MEQSSQDILNAALRLPPADRAELAAELIESLDEGVHENVEAAWDAEIARRIADMDSGKVKGISWQDVRKRIIGDVV